MTVEEFIQKGLFQVVAKGDHTERKIEDIFCCDLLSIAMSKAPVGGAWVTVMANINTLAVASLTETAFIVLAEGVHLDEETVTKAQLEGITVLETKESVYHAAKRIDQVINEANTL